MNKLLVQLPYTASTNKYPKYFPIPALLFKQANYGIDEIRDINLECYKQSDEFKTEKTVAIVEYIHKNYEKYSKIIVNMGDFPPDADKNEYFDLFLRLIKKKVYIMGVYPTINKLEDKENYIVMPTDFDTRGMQFPKEFLMRYPSVGEKLRASMKITNGCPRLCSMCPAALIYKAHYQCNAVGDSINEIKCYYHMGVRFITFTDDNLSAHKSFKEFLTRLKAENLKGMQYICQEGFEVTTLTDESIVKLLKELNFVDNKVGVENIKADFLKEINKCYRNPKLIDKIIENVRKHELEIRFIFLISESLSESDIMDNLFYFADNGISNFRINVIRPYKDSTYKVDKVKTELKTLNKLKALAYSSGFFIEKFNINIFRTKLIDFVKEKGYTFIEDKHTFSGKINFGFDSSHFINGLKYMIEQHYGKKIVKLKINENEITFELERKYKYVFN
jgi:hypothetical protein